jgi:hypothetical protein
MIKINHSHLREKLSSEKKNSPEVARQWKAYRSAATNKSSSNSFEGIPVWRYLIGHSPLLSKFSVTIQSPIPAGFIKPDRIKLGKNPTTFWASNMIELHIQTLELNKVHDASTTYNRA